VLTGGVGFCAPSAGRGDGASKCMVAELLTVGALCEEVELQSAFDPESF
jgi:hypothetical protein